MPLPLAPLILAGATLAGGAANSISTARQNRKSREFSQQQYTQQRDDNIRLWRMQNDYNSPSSQMQRFRNAGINPNLIYGGSTSGAAGNASGLSAPSASTPQFEPNRLGESLQDAAGVGINSVYDLRRKGLENDNLRAQNNVIVQDSVLRAAQTAKVMADTKTSKFDLGLKSELRAVSAEAMRENLRQMKQKTTIDGIDSDRRGARLSMDFDLNREKLNQIRAQTKDTKAGTRLKELEEQLQQLGLGSNSPFYFKMLARALKQIPGLSFLFDK